MPLIEEGRLYRGRGGEYIRHAVSKLIEAIALSKISLSRNKELSTVEKIAESNIKSSSSFIPIPKSREKSIAIILQETLDENLKHPSEEVQLAAVDALKIFWKNCYSFPPKKYALDLVSRYLNTIQNDPNPAVRRGFVLAMGVMPREFIVESKNVEKVLTTLLSTVQIDTNSDFKDAKTRQNAIRVLVPFLENIGIQQTNSDGLSQSQLEQIFEGFMTGIADYSVDNRGDVGSWVREETIHGFRNFFYFLYNFTQIHQNWNLHSLLTPSNCHKMMCVLIQQSLEKLDRLRGVAMKTIHELIHLPITFVSYQSLLVHHFPK